MPRQNSKSQPKSIASALLAGALIITLTGCANGDDAPTRMIKQVTDGVEAVSGEVKATNVLLVAQADGSAVLIATVVNNGSATDSIQSITANGIQGIKAPIDLTTAAPAIFSGPSANQSVVFPGLNLKASQHATIEFTFATAAPIKLNALVREQSGIYANTTK